jgi:hypothetical protein
MAAISNTAIEELRTAVAGVVAVPGEPGYDEAVNIWNGAITKRPGVVCRCTTDADVIAALRAARSNGLEVSVRGGGHNYGGFALTDGGLMIDLTPMKTVTVDPDARVATCGGGVTWAEMDAATQQHGLAAPCGFISTTGVAGLTLGGGIGWLSRYAGLSSDNLRAATVVTADGTVLRASDTDNPELVWALRGGGGNFGVVTSFEFALHPVGPIVHLAMFFYAPDQGREMLRFGRDFVVTLPDDCAVFMAGLNAPPEPFVPEPHQGAPMWALLVVGLANADRHARLIAPVRAGTAPVFEMVTPIPYVALQQMFNGSAPWGIRAYEKAVYLDELSDPAIDVMVEQQPKKTSPLSFLPIFVLGGAYARADEEMSAFGGRRNCKYVVNIAAAGLSEELYQADRAWVQAYWDALVPHSLGIGSYINFIADDDQDRVRAAFGPAKYARLARIKATYDPDNTFHLNPNIQPAAG